MNAEGREYTLGWRGNDGVEAEQHLSPAIAVLRWLAKEGIKQNILILRPLLLSSEEIHSYLGGSFLVRFWLPKNEHKKTTAKNTENTAFYCHAEYSF